MATSSSAHPPDRGDNNDGKNKAVQEAKIWYFSKKEIEENSPSRGDGIDLKKEDYLRKYYSTYLQHIYVNLDVPQAVIATAIVLCHRFFMRQSHSTIECRTIATSCMFLATKVEEDERDLKDIIRACYEVSLHTKSLDEIQSILTEELYEQATKGILEAERLVLETLCHDLQVDQPYKIMVNLVTEFNVNRTDLIEAARNMVNDGLRTTLWLQFTANQVAVCAIFLGGRFLKIELEIDGEQIWWQKFNVTTLQVADFCDQLLEFYEKQDNTPLEPVAPELRVGAPQFPATQAAHEVQNRAAMRIELIERARLLRESILSDEKFVPLLPLKHSDDEVAKRIYDKAKAAREVTDRKRAIIETRKRAHGTSSFLTLNKKTKSEKDSKDAS